MSDEKEKKIFSKNLNYYMKKHGKTQPDIIAALGINKSTISTWCNGTKMPRMGTIQSLADYFGIKKSDLVEEKQETSPEVITYTEHEVKVLDAYRSKPEMQPAVDRLLGVEPEESEYIELVARGGKYKVKKEDVVKWAKQLDLEHNEEDHDLC